MLLKTHKKINSGTIFIIFTLTLGKLRGSTTILKKKNHATPKKPMRMVSVAVVAKTALAV